MSSTSVSVGIINKHEGGIEICLTISNGESTTHTRISTNIARVLANTMLDLSEILDQAQPAKEE